MRCDCSNGVSRWKVEDPVEQTEHSPSLDYPSTTSIMSSSESLLPSPPYDRIALGAYHCLMLLSSSSEIVLLGEVVSEVVSSSPWHVSSLGGSASSLFGTDRGLWLELRFGHSWPWRLRWFSSYRFLREHYSCTYVEYRQTWRAKMMMLVRLSIHYACRLPNNKKKSTQPLPLSFSISIARDCVCGRG